jgi:hypothetical protein
MRGDIPSDPQALAALADKIEKCAEELDDSERMLLRKMVDLFLDPLDRVNSLEGDDLLDHEEKQILADLDATGAPPVGKKLPVLGQR